MSSNHLLLMGKVIRPHGLGGSLRISSYAESGESFLKCGTVLLESVSGGTDEYEVVSVTPHHKCLLVKVRGMDSFTQAERYRGAAIFARKETLAPKGEEEYLWDDLIGMDVYSGTGKHIGTLREVLPTGSNDIYVVRQGKKEVLIPAIHEVVREIDLENKKMIISHMEGLFDLNED